MTGNKVPHRVYFGFMDSYIYTHFTKLQASINCHAPIHDYKGQSKQLKLIATVNCTDRLLSPTHILTVPRNTPNANEDRPCTHPPHIPANIFNMTDFNDWNVIFHFDHSGRVLCQELLIAFFIADKTTEIVRSKDSNVQTEPAELPQPSSNARFFVFSCIVFMLFVNVNFSNRNFSTPP